MFLSNFNANDDQQGGGRLRSRFIKVIQQQKMFQHFHHFRSNVFILVPPTFVFVKGDNLSRLLKERGNTQLTLSIIYIECETDNSSWNNLVQGFLSFSLSTYIYDAVKRETPKRPITCCCCLHILCTSGLVVNALYIYIYIRAPHSSTIINKFKRRRGSFDNNKQQQLMESLMNGRNYDHPPTKKGDWTSLLVLCIDCCTCRYRSIYSRID